MMIAIFSWDLALLAAADDDAPNGYWLLALLIISAITWISQKLKEKRHAEHVAQIAKEAQEVGWESEYEEDDQNYAPPPQQVPQQQSPPVPPRQPSTASSELKQFFESLVGVPQQAAPPPPRPAVQTPPPPPPRKKSEEQLTATEQRALASLKSGKSNLSKGRSHRQRLHSSAEHNALGKMLHDPGSLRNAFILKEILEPPLAARESQMPHTI